MRNIVNKSESKRLLYNFFYLASMQGLNYILPLLTMPYLFKVLGSEKFGLVAFALSTVMFLNVVVDYGFNLSATRAISSSSDKKELAEIYSTVLSAKIILIFISFFILTLLIIVIAKFRQEWELFYLSFLLVIGNGIFPIWFFQGMEEMKYISYLTMMAKIFFTIGIFILVKTPSDYLYQPLLNGLGYIIVGGYSLYLIPKRFQIYFTIQPLKKIRHEFQNGWNIFMVQFMPNIYNNFSVFLLGFITTMANVGLYSLAMNIVNVFNQLITVMSNVTYPFLNKKFSSFKKITIIMLVSGGVMSIALITGSVTILPFLFGVEASKILELICVLAFSPLIFAITYSYGCNKLLVFNRDYEYKKIIVNGSIIGLIGLIIMSYYFGIIGAAINVIFVRLYIAYFAYIKSKGVII